MIYKGRAFSIFLLIIVGFLWSIWRLVGLQIKDGEEMRKRADRLHTTTLTIRAERGEIFDRRGNPLALNVPSYSIFWRRGEIGEIIERRKLRNLSTMIGADWRSIEKRINEGAKFIYLARFADRESLELVKKNPVRGVEWKKEKKRFYPSGSLASHIVGFVGVDEGLEGVERYYADFLEGERGLRRVGRDGKRNILPTLGEELYLPRRGHNIYLTIDNVIQHIVEKELNEIEEKFKPRAIVAIMLEAETGRILAMANRPTYDPNAFREFPSTHFRNIAISDSFEPGSGFKIITAAIALEENIISPHDLIFCENGRYRVAGHTIRDVRPHGWLTFAETIEVSSNIAFAKIGGKIGAERLYNYIRNFGFGLRTGIDLQGEAKGILRDLDQWSRLSVPVISFGQEIATTPLQLAVAVGAVANGGLLMKPFVVDRIVDEDGNIIKERKPTVVKRVISPETSRVLNSLLVGAVENGTGRGARIEGHRIAGKTGTAQKFIPGEGYSDTKFVASFIGYTLSDPQVVLLIMVDEPRGAIFGGVVAAPAFRNIMDRALMHLRVPPERRTFEMVRF